MRNRPTFNLTLVILILCGGLLACNSNSQAEDEATQICLSRHAEGSPEFNECMEEFLGDEE